MSAELGALIGILTTVISAVVLGFTLARFVRSEIRELKREVRGLKSDVKDVLCEVRGVLRGVKARATGNEKGSRSMDSGLQADESSRATGEDTPDDSEIAAAAQSSPDR